MLCNCWVELGEWASEWVSDSWQDVLAWPVLPRICLPFRFGTICHWQAVILWLVSWVCLLVCPGSLWTPTSAPQTLKAAAPRLLALVLLSDWYVAASRGCLVSCHSVSVAAACLCVFSSLFTQLPAPMLFLSLFASWLLLLLVNVWTLLLVSGLSHILTLFLLARPTLCALVKCQFDADASASASTPASVVVQFSVQFCSCCFFMFHAGRRRRCYLP